MGVYGLKPRFRVLLAPVGRWVSRFHPNTISASSVVFALLAGTGLFFAPSAPWVYLVVPVLFFLRIAANALDGMVAQWTDRASARGELVNEFSDRINDVLILGGLLLSGVVNILLGAGAVVLVLLISYMGILPRAAGGPRLYEGPLGKADRMLYLGLACLAAFILPVGGWVSATQVFEAMLVVFIITGLITLVRRIHGAWRHLNGVGSRTTSREEQE